MPVNEEKEIAEAFAELCAASGTIVFNAETRSDELALKYARYVSQSEYEIEDAALERDVIVGAPNAFNQILKPWFLIVVEMIAKLVKRRQPAHTRDRTSHGKRL